MKQKVKTEQLFTVPNNFFYRWLIRRVQKKLLNSRYCLTVRGRSRRKGAPRSYYGIPLSSARRLGIYIKPRGRFSLLRGQTLYFPTGTLMHDRPVQVDSNTRIIGSKRGNC